MTSKLQRDVRYLTGRFLATLIALDMVVCASLAEETVGNRFAIVGADIVNPLGYPSLTGATLIVDGDTITAVGTTGEIEVPANARVIDGRGQWIIPGLMDLHVHFGQSGTLVGAYQGNKPDPMESSKSFAPGEGLTAPKFAVERVFRQFARAGVTTVRSLGEYDWAHSGPHALRPRAARDPLAPRLVLSTTAYYPRTIRPSSRRITSSAQGIGLLRRFVEQHDVDVLKVWWVHGRFSGETDQPDEWKTHQAIVQALLEEAKRLGIGNGVDAIEAEKAKEVVRMNGNLVHGIFFGKIDQECLDLMKSNQTQITSTLAASNRYFGAVAGQLRYTTTELLLGDPHVMAQTLDLRGQDADKLVIPRGGSRFDGMTLADAMRAPPYTEEIIVAVENLRRIHEHGIPVGIGTDAGIPGMLFGASIFTEFAVHEDAGFTPHEILTAATLNNAQILGREDELGSITPGKKADLVLLAGDPRLDISHLAKIRGVVVRGRHFSVDELNDDSAWDIVTRLRNAYNCNDRRAITSLLSPEVTYRDVPGDITLAGAKGVLDRFAQGADGKSVRAVVSYSTSGGTVIQKERWPDSRVYVVQYYVTNKQVTQITVVAADAR